MLAGLFNVINFIPIFVICGALCPNSKIAGIVTIVAMFIWYFITLIPKVGEILVIISWIVAIPLLLIFWKLPMIIIYFVVFAVKIIGTVLIIIQEKKKS